MSEEFLFDVPLGEADAFANLLIECEERRQAEKIILVASESIAPPPVREALASVFSNIYAEGYPTVRMTKSEEELLSDLRDHLAYHRRYGDRRYYKGCDYANFIESLAQRRCAELFSTEAYPPESIFVNVQPLSGASANNAIYEGFLKPGDTVMGMALSHGGHLTHGSEANRSGKRYRIIPYYVDAKTGKLDYEYIRRLALEHQPRMIIAGYSAYPWSVDWAEFAEIRDSVPECILMADIAHPAGLVAAGLFPNPVGYADVITFTTHKTLCGPRGACIITTDPENAHRVNTAVFPGEQGGPHIHTIAGKAVCFKLAQTEQFRRLQKRIVENAQAMCEAFRELGATIAYGGTDSHMLLIDLFSVETGTSYPLRGEVASRILDLCGITLNKNTIAGDEDPIDPGAIRLGTTWVSQRGMGGKEMKKIAELIWKVLTNIKTVSYYTHRGRVGRGKIDEKLMREVQADVARLIEPHPPCVKFPLPPLRASSLLSAVHKEATGKDDPDHYGNPDAELASAREGLAVFDLWYAPVLSVRGERAEVFLQETLTADILSLRVGESVPSLMLDRNGEVREFFLVHRKAVHSYLLLPAGLSGDEPARWFTSLSDGYVVFDTEDYFRKIDGPVVVEDLRESGKTLIALSGKGEFPSEVALFELDCPVRLAFIVAEQNGVVVLWKRLCQSATPSGREVWRRLLGDVIKQPASLTKSSKPYFIGRNRLRATGKPKQEFHFEDCPPAEARRTVLYEEHIKLAGKRRMTVFAGWSLPLYYVSIGHEHSATRRSSALYDVSHMGIFEVAGEGAVRFLDLVTSNFVYGLKVGQAHYTYLLDIDGVPIDDIIIYRVEPERFILVTNAVNEARVEAWLKAVASRQVIIDRENPHLEVDAVAEVRNIKSPEAGDRRLVDLALQGPRSLEILEKLATGDGARQLRHLAKFRLGKFLLDGVPAIVSRTGYTGEHYGYEIFVHPDSAVQIWNRILELGKPSGVAPAGLAARDAARMEAGLPLHGHEVAGPHRIFPVEAGYGAFVKLHKPFFIGRKPSVEKELNYSMCVVRFQLRERNVRAIRHGDPVVNLRGECIGYVTSAGQISGFQLGMAYIRRAYAKEGERLGIFPLPRGASAEWTSRPITELELGDRVPTHLEATVLPRFLPLRKVRQRLLEQVT